MCKYLERKNFKIYLNLERKKIPAIIIDSLYVGLETVTPTHTLTDKLGSWLEPTHSQTSLAHNTDRYITTQLLQTQWLIQWIKGPLYNSVLQASRVVTIEHVHKNKKLQSHKGSLLSLFQAAFGLLIVLSANVEGSVIEMKITAPVP